MKRAHDHGTRAAQWQRQRRFARIAALAAACLISWPAMAAQQADDMATGTVARRPAHEVRMRHAEPGGEGLELLARLTEDGDPVSRELSWKVRGADGETVYESGTAVADFLTKPGDYEVTLKYGAVTVKSAVALLEEQRLSVMFTLDAGGIRVLARVGGAAVPSVRAVTDVIALGEDGKARRVAVTSVPGEIVRLGAGRYRIETRFEPGNASAGADVTVNAGRLSAVQIDHVAGIARLALAGPAGAARWTIRDSEGNPLPPIEGPSADVVLKPGRYTAQVATGGGMTAVEFAIAAGETREVTLSP